MLYFLPQVYSLTAGHSGILPGALLFRVGFHALFEWRGASSDKRHQLVCNVSGQVMGVVRGLMDLRVVRPECARERSRTAKWETQPSDWCWGSDAHVFQFPGLPISPTALNASFPNEPQA